MLFIRILNYIKGYLIISIKGVFAERFINICVHRGILLWDVSFKNGAFVGKIGTKDFFKIRNIAFVTRSRIRIVRRRGLPFLLKQYQSRWPVIFGILLFAAIVNFTSTHIMSVDITGNERIPTELLRQQLDQVGVGFGKSVSGLTPDQIRNQMIVANNDIAWLGVNIRGSRVYIEITERLDTESVPHVTEEKCNVVAAKDGVIRRLEVKQGQTVVKKGDAVREGDLLVSGIMDSVYGGFRTVHAYGDIYAETEYAATREYPLKYTEREYTGRETARYSLRLMGREINLYPNSMSPGEGYEERREEHIYQNGNFDGGFIKKTFAEYTETERQRTVSEAVEQGARELNEEVKALIPDSAEILENKIEHNILSGDLVSVTVTYICNENIAKESIIDESLIDKSEILDYDIIDEENGSD